MLPRWIRAAMLVGSSWVLERLTTEHQVRGFRVRVLNSEKGIDTDDVLERLGDALDLIVQYQPIRFRHLRRDVSHFLVRRYASRGAYWGTDQAILTELTFLNRRDISAAVVASSILHEGVHARIAHLARNMAFHEPAREERICRRAELAFGRALPLDEGAPIIARAEESLALGDEDIAPRFTEAEGWAAVRAAERARKGTV